MTFIGVKSFFTQEHTLTCFSHYKLRNFQDYATADLQKENERYLPI